LLWGVLASAALHADEEVGAGYYARWLEEVDVLLEPAERRAFGALTNDRDRERFLHGFWEARAGSGANALRLRWAENAAEARAQLGRLDDDRGRLILLAGPPTHYAGFDADDDVTEPCGIWKPLQILYYAAAPDRERFYAVFYPYFRGSPRYRRWRPGEGIDALLAWTRSSRRDELLRMTPADALERALDLTAQRGCLDHVPQLRGMIEAAITGDARAPDLDAIRPRADPGWLDAFADRLAASSAAGEPPHPLPEVSYQAYGEQTLLSLAWRLPLSLVTSRPPERDGYRSVTATVEVVGGESDRDLVAECSQKLWIADDADGAPGDSVPLRLDCALAPGSHRVVLRVFSGESAPARRVLDVEAPSLLAQERRPERLLDRRAPALTLALESPPSPALGRTTVRAQALSSEIVAIRFLVDGVEAGVDRDPPFAMALEHGLAPRRYRVEAVGLDHSGREVARDAAELDARPRLLRLRLRERERPAAAPGESAVEAVLELPPGAAVETLDFFLDDEPLATLEHDPWLLRLDRPARPRVLRGAATLRDGRIAEDVLVVGGGDLVARVEVRAVELYVTVEGPGGDPVPDLEIADLEVLENGRRQRVLELERVERLPLSVAVVADASSSMEEELELERTAAMRFFRSMLRTGDRGSFFVFDQQTHLVVPLTEEVEWLEEGTRGLRAAGGTALYDSLAVALYSLGGIRGQRALVLFSDGHDQHSAFDYDAVRDLVRRADVTLYPVHLWIETPSATHRAREQELKTRLDAAGRLRALTRDSGGVFQAPRRAAALDQAFRRIEDDLRAQYRVAYQSSHGEADGSFRAVAVRSKRKGVSLRTRAGYFAD
jgi:VWFA-related protein